MEETQINKVEGMMVGQKEIKQEAKTMFDIIEKDSIFERILCFLDGQSISQVILVCSHARFGVGRNLKQVIEKQQAMLITFEKEWNILNPCFHDLDRAVANCDDFLNEEEYRKFIKMIKFENCSYFSEFFSLCLGVTVNLTKQHFYEQKQGLFALAVNVWKALDGIKNRTQLPNLSNALFTPQVIIEEGNDQKKNKILKTVMQIMVTLKNIKEKGFGKDQLLRHALYDRYVSQERKSGLNRIIGGKMNEMMYKSKLYYFSKQRDFYQMVNHNMLGIILSFLNTSDLFKIRLVSSTLSIQVRKVAEIVKNKWEQTIQSKKQFIKSLLNPNLEELIHENTKIEVTKCYIHEINAFRNHPQIILQIYELLFQVIDVQKLIPGNRDLLSNLRYYNKLILRNEENIYGQNFFSTLDSSQAEKMRIFLEQYNLQQCARVSLVAAKIFQNLKINYELNLANISKEQYHKLLQCMLEIKNQEQMIGKLTTFQKYLNKSKVK